MIEQFLAKQILAAFPHTPTEQQQALIHSVSQFLHAGIEEKAFVLKGYAGTGKTSVVAAMVRALSGLKQKTVQLAPTGRAAKVLSSYAGFPAFTIHKKIYRQQAMGVEKFQLAENLMNDTLFIVDEASMISNTGGDSEFGSGFLLDDLIRFVYNGRNCFLMLLGDIAQLPPVMQEDSPALDRQKLESFGLEVTEFQLTQVVRQALQSGILYNATILRKALEDQLTSHLPKLHLQGFSDIKALGGMELVDEVSRSYAGVGVEDTIIITRSNKMANIYNKGIRASVMMLEDEIANGDLLMVTRNNYFWNKPYPEIDFVANGDILQVKRVGRYSEMYGFRFVELTLESLDFGWEMDARVWIESLYSESPAQQNELSKKLFDAVAEDYADIPNKRERLKQMFENPYLNALQLKFAYAVTCHKAQGGQWKKVFVDMNMRPDAEVDRNYYRWLYTALTRASEQVYLVNYPEKMLKGHKN
jgi:exodeoxyribonuclease-5